MPKKPQRPISWIVHPASGAPWLKLETLPVEKEQLERKIVERFVLAVARIEGEAITCIREAPEPGDVLVTHESGEKVYLQLGEVVDVGRIRTNEQRAEYGAALWDVNPDLRKAYAGVQVAIIDAGEVSELPKALSAHGTEVLRALASEMKRLVPIVESLPDNAPGELRGKETSIRCPNLKHPITIRLLRYATAKSRQPLKWLWTGTHQIRKPQLDTGFRAVMAKKIARYGSISNLFWLVLYSLDCECYANEQSALVSELRKEDHPFDRVYLFFPNSGDPGEVRRLFPTGPESVVAQPQSSKKLLARFLPEDAVPKWDDPRWCTPS